MGQAAARSTSTSSTAPTEVLAGLVERVTYHNAENGFCVLRVKARGHKDLVTVVGHAATIAAGEWVQLSGTWTNDRSHGLQFRAGFLKASPPTTLEDIERYLGSGMIRGIGPAYAGKLVRAFGEAIFDLIEAEPGRLHEVTGIGPKRAARIVAGWAEQKVIREIMLFLHAHGVGTSRAVRIYKTYGASAVQVISENPYRLARDIRGIGFRTADLVAQRLGIEPTAMIRVRAGISFALAKATGEGHCGLPLAELTAQTAALIEVLPPLIQTALELELEAGEVVADTLEGERCVFLAGLHRAERAITERLRALAQGAPPWPGIDAVRAISWVESRTGLSLAPSQREALRLATRSKVLVITGGPGVGKTTLVNSILRVLYTKRVEVALCAHTGRAARRLSDSTGMEARTKTVAGLHNRQTASRGAGHDGTLNLTGNAAGHASMARASATRFRHSGRLCRHAVVLLASHDEPQPHGVPSTQVLISLDSFASKMLPGVMTTSSTATWPLRKPPAVLTVCPQAGRWMKLES